MSTIQVLKGYYTLLHRKTVLQIPCCTWRIRFSCIFVVVNSFHDVIVGIAVQPSLRFRQGKRLAGLWFQILHR